MLIYDFSVLCVQIFILSKVLKEQRSQVCSFFLCFFFLFWPHMQHMEVPGPGMKSKVKLQSMPQLWQCQILNLLYHSGNSNRFIFFNINFLLL